MKTEVLPPDARSLARAGQILRAGGLVAFPTETVYGLGANALCAEAVARIFEAKGRPSNNPLIVHVESIAAAQVLVVGWPAIASLLARHFWPGPLTLVLGKAAHIPGAVTAGGDTVALRIPAHPVAIALLHEANVPIAAPSANRSNRLSPTLSEHVLRDLDGRIDLLLDGGLTGGGLESTVLDVTETPPRLLRPGLVTRTQIEEVVGPIALAGTQGGTLRSPGMLARHYAPRTPLHCRALCVEQVNELVAQGKRVGWVTFFAQSESPVGTHVVEMPADARAYSAQIYAVLHSLDQLELDAIFVDLPPMNDDWQAVHDRLRRASLAYCGLRG